MIEGAAELSALKWSGAAAAGHGFFQGTTTFISGGEFWSGFAAGSLSSLAASAWSGGETSSYYEAVDRTFVTSHQGIGGFLGMQNTAGMIAFGTVMGGASAELSGGNFWQGAVSGLVVSGLNHAMHKMDDDDDSIDPPTKKGKIQTKQKTMPEKLHNMFDAIEEVGGWMEIGGLVAAPFTEGTSLGVTMAGGYFSAIGTTGNILVDGYQYLDTKKPMYLKSATFRGVKAVATAGMGKAIDRISGGKYMTDKIILKAQVFVYEKLVTPVLQRKL